jgi:hypothetical protein
MLSKNNMYFIIIAVIGLFLFGYLFTKFYLYSSLYTDKVLINNFAITSNWKEIEFQELIKVEKDNQFICISLEKPYEADVDQKGIKTPTGTIAKPEIKLIDEKNNEYILQFAGSRGGEMGNDIANYDYKNLPDEVALKKMLIRSDQPIKTKQILWSGFNTKDLK